MVVLPHNKYCYAPPPDEESKKKVPDRSGFIRYMADGKTPRKLKNLHKDTMFYFLNRGMEKHDNNIVIRAQVDNTTNNIGYINEYVADIITINQCYSLEGIDWSAQGICIQFKYTEPKAVPRNEPFIITFD